MNTKNGERKIVTTIDSINITLTLLDEIGYTYNHISPTYVQMTVMYCHKAEIGQPGRYTIGETVIGGSYVPTNVQICFIYTNNKSMEKKMRFVLKYCTNY